MGLDDGASLTCQYLVDVVDLADHGSASGVLREGDRSGDFRTHGTGREVEAGKSIRADPPDGPLGTRPPVQEYRLGVGGHDEQVGVDRARQDRRAGVLVDDGLDTREMTVLVTRHGDAAPAGADDDVARFEQLPDGVDLHDALRYRGGHHAAAGRPVQLERPASLGGEGVGLCLGVDRADELGGVAEGRILGAHLDQGQHRRQLLLGGKDVTHLDLDEIADHPLAFGT